MNFKTTFVLLALLLIVGAAVWMFPRSPEPASPDKEDAGAQQFTPVFDPLPAEADVRKIELAQPGKPTLIFERAADQGDKGQTAEWRIVSPVQAPAETWLASGLINTFGRLQSHLRFEPGRGPQVTAEEAGLTAPRATVTFTKADGKALTLQVGKQREIPNGTYVRAAGSNTIHLIERDFSTELKRELKDYRAKVLTKFSVNDARQIALDSGGRHYELTKTADGDWLLNEPVRARADLKKVNELLTKIAALRAVEFMPDADNAVYGLDKPASRIVISTETRKAKPTTAPAGSEPPPPPPEFETTTGQVVLAVGNFSDLKQTNRVVQVDGGGVAAVAKTALDPLEVKLADLVDMQVTGLAKDQISKLEIRHGDEAAVLERRNGAWSGTGDLATLEPDAVVTLAQTLQDLRAINLVEKPETLENSGLDNPRAVITATTQENLNTVTLRVGATTASGINAYVRVEGQPIVYVVDAKEAAKLVVPALSLRSRTIVDVKPEDITRIERTRGGASYVAAREGTSWKLQQPADATADLAAVQEIAADLARLRAKRVVAREQVAQYGLDKPDVTLRFTITPSAPPAASATQPSGATQPASGDAAPPAAGAAAAQPQQAAGTGPVQRTLLVAWRDGAAFAKLDQEPFVYELDESVYKVLTGELLRREIFDFSADAVTRVRVTSDGPALELVKDAEGWKLGSDPYVKLAQDRVKAYVADLAKLRAEEYVQYRDATAPQPVAITVHVQLDNERQTELQIGGPQAESGARIGYLPEQKRSFKLRPLDVENLTRKLDYFLQPDKPATPPMPPPNPVRPGLPGLPGGGGGPQ